MLCLVCLLLCKEEGSSPVSAITERMDMRCPCLCLCWVLGWGHMGSIMLVLRAVQEVLCVLGG